MIVEWLGETVRQVDSSLLDEWEALNHPDRVPRSVADHAPPPPPRPLTQQGRVFDVMVRNAMWRRVELVARDDLDGLVALEAAAAAAVEPPREVVMTPNRLEEALDGYFSEHEHLLTDADARGPGLLAIEKSATEWFVTQTLHDPAGYHDWVLEAVVDLPASDEVGEAVVRLQDMRRLGG